MSLPPLSPHKEFEKDPFRQGYRIVLFFGLLALCCFIRLWALGGKTMMHDELLFTKYTYSNLYQEFNYYYQPILHGPLMLHIQNLVFHLFGPSDFTVRLGSALLGIASFFWIWKLRYWLRETGTWFSLAFFAISPGIAFFHRFFHQDALYLFCSLWIIASLANFWKTRDGRWGASAIIASAALFNNKASAIFIYFTVLTFLALLVIHDVSSYFLEGKHPKLKNFLNTVPKMPGATVMMLVASGLVILVLSQVFEGLRYDNDVTKTLGHDWVLKDIRSIPIALGWVSLSPSQAQGVGALAEAGIWKKFYLGLFLGTFLIAGLIKVFVEFRVGRSEFLTRLWQRIHETRWYLLGAIAFSFVFYLVIYTTFFQHKIGVFDIYRKTWAYWGGQHEIGRISGPFHQHILNLMLYEAPAVLIILGAWIIGLFKMKFERSTGIAFLLMIIAVGAFHKLLFSDLSIKVSGEAVPVEVAVGLLKYIFFAGVFVGVGTILFPKAGKIVAPAAMVAMVTSCIVFFSSNYWKEIYYASIYRHGEKVEMMGRHINMKDFMEAQFNFDGAWNLVLVLILIFFATLYTWNAFDQGRRFHGFLVWWFVTMLGSACYAREGVPQVGIHVMLPAILLAGSYAERFVQWQNTVMMRRLAWGFLGVMLLWNMKATFNLNFRNPDDPRERMAYGPSNPDVKAHMDFIRDYHKIASLRKDGGKLEVYKDYNNKKKHKDVQVMIKVLDQVTWPAKWYLRDIDYQESNNIQQAITDDYEFIFVGADDEATYPELAEKYHIARGRGTTFWTPDPFSAKGFTDIWKEGIPGHYLDRSPQAGEASNAKKEWKTLWRYIILRETFDGTSRRVPSISSFDYLFCYRKGLF
jgi:predicted membrane-bound mannosyltransferase